MSSIVRYASKVAVSITLLTAQILHAGHRRDLPSLENQDPSGVFGPPEAPLLRVAVLGDSSVTAPGVEPLDAAWPRRVAHHFSDRFRVELCSVAVGGSKVRDVLATQVEPAIECDPHLAIVSVGANDALRTTPVDLFEIQYRELLARLTASLPGVVLSGVGDLGTIPRLPALARSVARIRGRAIDHAIARAAYDFPQVVKANAWSSLWDPFLEDPDSIFAPDLFHASASGHAIYAEAMIPAVEVVIGMLGLDPAMPPPTPITAAGGWTERPESSK